MLRQATHSSIGDMVAGADWLNVRGGFIKIYELARIEVSAGGADYLDLRTPRQRGALPTLDHPAEPGAVEPGLQRHSALGAPRPRTAVYWIACN